jgi:uncharacterized membrane protein
MLAAMVSFHHYWTIIFCICPIANFYFFFGLTKRDNEKNKLKFYFSLLYTTPLMIAEQIIASVYRNTGGRCQAKDLPERQEKYICSTIGTVVEVSYVVCMCLLLIYFTLVVRQNWLNCKEGVGNHD